ncbi:uncharacterized protein LOC143786868 [Ranitomeya variabilis]|uniref:uncharacterized protein LOC143786868 n=1 Tax=Ranitomeya variabilis TaxID=490064 RepID=UPI004056E05E
MRGETYSRQKEIIEAQYQRGRLIKDTGSHRAKGKVSVIELELSESTKLYFDHFSSQHGAWPGQHVKKKCFTQLLFSILKKLDSVLQPRTDQHVSSNCDLCSRDNAEEINHDMQQESGRERNPADGR